MFKTHFMMCGINLKLQGKDKRERKPSTVDLNLRDFRIIVLLISMLSVSGNKDAENKQASLRSFQPAHIAILWGNCSLKFYGI